MSGVEQEFDPCFHKNKLNRLPLNTFVIMKVFFQSSQLDLFCFV